MTRFAAVDLSKLAPPQIVEEIDIEAILSELKAFVIAANPELTDVLALESEPIVKLLEAFAYRETLIRSRINDAAKACMLAFARGSDLDHLAALFNVQRLVVRPADPVAIPPISEVLEADDAFRSRIQISLEGHSTAGHEGGYVFAAMSADATVKDVDARRIAPGIVGLTVLSTVGDGVADGALLAKVLNAASAETARPLLDDVQVSSVAILPYDVVAEIKVFEGPDANVIVAAARASLEAFVADRHRLGHDVTISGLHGALHQPGVQNVILSQPSADLVVSSSEAAFCTNITITLGGTDV